MIHFYNKGKLEMDFVRLMGVSVKDGDNPFGMFGTGLKYAIAVILRLRMDISIMVGDDYYTFGTKEKVIRGTSFKIVTMNGEDLAFTTELGSTWEPWMAYRELYSNSMDENGGVTKSIPPAEQGTVITVTGGIFDDIYIDSKKYFLDKDGESMIEGTDFISMSVRRGNSDWAFYQGIRAYETSRKFMFRWNTNTTMPLTEDRSVKTPYLYTDRQAAMVSKSTNEAFITDVVTSGPAWAEGNLDFSYVTPDETFQKVVLRNAGEDGMNASALRRVIAIQPAKSPVEVEMNPLNLDDVREALDILNFMGIKLALSDFKVADNLGMGIFGKFVDGEIFISSQTVDRGSRFIASTLFEEWCHKTNGVVDESREFQDLLLDRLIQYVVMAKKLSNA